MENDFQNFIAHRCSSALQHDQEYQNMMKEKHSVEEELDLVMRVCYSVGFADRGYVAKKCSQYDKIYQ